MEEIIAGLSPLGPHATYTSFWIASPHALAARQALAGASGPNRSRSKPAGRLPGARAAWARPIRPRGSGASPGGGAIEPADRFCPVLRHADAKLVGTTDTEQAPRIVLLGAALKPAKRLGPVLGDTDAVLVAVGEVVLRGRVALLRRAPVPPRRERRIARQTLAKLVLIADLALRQHVPAFRGRLEQGGGLREALRLVQFDAAPEFR